MTHLCVFEMPLSFPFRSCNLFLPDKTGARSAAHHQPTAPRDGKGETGESRRRAFQPPADPNISSSTREKIEVGLDVCVLCICDVCVLCICRVCALYLSGRVCALLCICSNNTEHAIFLIFKSTPAWQPPKISHPSLCCPPRPRTLTALSEWRHTPKYITQYTPFTLVPCL